MTVIIETPKGSSCKYSYDKKTASFMLAKMLPVGMVFPYDFGFIPGTKGEDGDPLDIIVISEMHTFPGCRMKCRIIGCMKASQKEKDGKKVRNDRFLAVPEEAIMYSHVTNYRQFPAVVIQQLEDFFIQYNKLSDKKFVPLGMVGPKNARGKL